MSKFIGNRYGSVVPIGPGSAAGPAVYNIFDHYYAQQESGWISEGMTATGGIINEYSEPSGNIYRSHTFLVGGTFSVTDLGDLGGTVDILVVGGGAGGNASIYGYWTGAGGGAGGMAVATSYPLSISPGSYPITVGAGGQASGLDPSAGGANYQGQSGSPTIFTNPSSPQTITALGGGAGGTGGSSPAGGNAPTGQAGIAGGSGGGGGPGPGSSSGGAGNQPSQNPGIPNLTNYGNAGAAGDSSSTVGRSGGGGGAGGAAEAIDGNPALTTDNAGGPGVANVYRFGPGSPITYAAGGGVLSPSSGAPNPTANFFVPASGLGNGGGGGTDGPSGEPGGNGGPGCVVIRYRIGTVSATAKASGGDVSFYGGKTIHAFTASGNMVFPSAFNETVEYVVIGGGGSGGQVYGGGGGAGAYRTGTSAVDATPGQISLTVTIGAGGAGESKNTYIGSPGTIGNIGRAGSSSSINLPAGTITSPGGGYGGVWVATAGGPGGSGGGGGANNPNPSGASGGTGTGDPFPGTIGATPSNGWGNDGGTGGAYNEYGSGGGGGAGGVGESVPGGTATRGRKGGAGIQLPTTFRDPISTVGAPGPSSAPGPTFDTSAKYWVAGGGGSGIGGATGLSRGGGGGAPTPVETYSGGGAGGFAPGHPVGSPYPSNLDGQSGGQSSGGGGGGSAGVGQGSSQGTYGNSGSGGSGLVLVAYPT